MPRLMEKGQDFEEADKTQEHRRKANKNEATRFYIRQKTRRVMKTIMGRGQYFSQTKNCELGSRASCNYVSRWAC